MLPDRNRRSIMDRRVSETRFTLWRRCLRRRPEPRSNTCRIRALPMQSSRRCAAKSDFAFATLPAVIGQVQSGDLGRSVMPDRQRLPKCLQYRWYQVSRRDFGLLSHGPACWRRARRLTTAINPHQALKRASEDPKYKATLEAGGYKPASNSPEEFRAFLEQNISDWKQAAQAAGITPN